MIPLPRLPGPPLEPPLDPDGDEGRSLLRRELARPEYYTDNLVERIIAWFQRRFEDTVGAAESAPPLQTFAAILVAVSLVAGLGVLVSRARRTARARAEARPALTDEVVSADELRGRAEAALRSGRYDDALVDAYRALAVRQVEKGRIEDLPQATAHELARALGEVQVEHRAAIEHAADLFDSVLYGDHPATRQQAEDVLRLDDALSGRLARR